MTVGITGKTGSGKSEVARIFGENGFTVIDLDGLSRKVSDNSGPCLDEIVASFGEDVLKEDGTLNRRYLGEIVFADGEKLDKLSNITHKYILAEMDRVIDDTKGDIILDAPLLFEAGLDTICDVCIYVTADNDERIHRIMARDGIDEGVATSRLTRQATQSEYVSKCDYVIENLSTIDELRKRTMDVLDCISSGVKRHAQKE